MSLKRYIGRFLIPVLPINRHVFDHLRCELNGVWVRLLHRTHPAYRLKIAELKKARAALLNLGCGPFGLPGWINLDLFKHDNVILRTDCRYKLPISDEACIGIHVEHYFEHLTHNEEVPVFLSECRRCRSPKGVLRIIVPDAERFLLAYAQEGWGDLNALSATGTSAQSCFETKMQAVNHVMVQQHEHFGGYDFVTIASVLRKAGFQDVARCEFREGFFPNGCIDRDQHRPYSLYVEATK